MRTMVEYVLPDPTLEAYTWVHENEHGPASQPPLLRGGTNGMMPPPRDGVPVRLTVNGYTYTRRGAERPMDAQAGAPPDRLPLLLWEETWLPQVNTLRDEILAFDPASVAPGQWADTFQDHGRAFGRVFRGVHMETVMPSGRAVEQFLSAYVEAVRRRTAGPGPSALAGVSQPHTGPGATTLGSEPLGALRRRPARGVRARARALGNARRGRDI